MLEKFNVTAVGPHATETSPKRRCVLYTTTDDDAVVAATENGAAQMVDFYQGFYIADGGA